MIINKTNKKVSENTLEVSGLSDVKVRTNTMLFAFAVSLYKIHIQLLCSIAPVL